MRNFAVRLRKLNAAATFGPILGIFNQKLKLISDITNRWRSCWAKEIIFHTLAILEGVGTQKSIARAQNKHIFDQHQFHLHGCPTSIDREGF